MTGIVSPNMIEVRQGDSFNINLHFKKKCKDIDVTGWTCKMQVRDKDSGSVLFEVNETPVDVLHGKMCLNITPEMTKYEVGNYDCDIQTITENGDVNTIFPSDVNKIGTFRITQQVTR